MKDGARGRVEWREIDALVLLWWQAEHAQTSPSSKKPIGRARTLLWKVVSSKDVDIFNVREIKKETGGELIPDF